MAGLLNIGLTGLNAAQTQLSTASHNITNAGVAGYHRQTVMQNSLPAQFTGGGFIGQGTQVVSVARSYSQFLETQVMQADNRRAEYAAYGQQIGQINNLFADANYGLMPALDGFFAGVQEVAANPTSIPARQTMLSNAQTLVTRFQSMSTRLSEIRQGVESEIADTVEGINGFAQQIAEMNRFIVVAESAGKNVQANDLRDQRNQMVTELNQLIKVNALEEKDGSMSIFIGSGQSLVVGDKINRLAVAPSATDPLRATIAQEGAGGSTTALPERLLTGGKLAGLLGFRSESLDPAQSRLGLVAVSLATAFNRQHELGVDLNGELGQAFFKLGAIDVQPSGAVEVGFDPDAIGQLTDSDYRLINHDGTNFTLVRLSDGAKLVDNDVLPPSVDGLNITAGGLAAGDSALIQPTRNAAQGIALALTDTRQIAAGNPVSVAALSTNAGTATVSGIVVKDVSDMPQSASGVPAFDDVTLAFSETAPLTLTASFGSPPVSFIPSPAIYDTSEAGGKTFTFTIAPDPAQPGATFSFEFKLAGVPASGDRFVFSPTKAGVADNRNASLLGALQSGKLLFNAGSAADGAPTASIGGAYAQMVSSIGNKTREMQVNEKAQQAQFDQASSMRDGLSGVNLDEEAANLVRYQQAYQASAKVMSIAQRLFDEVLTIGR